MLLMATAGGSLRRWLVATGAVVGVIIGIAIGVNPGTSDINLTAQWAIHPIFAGVSGSGNPDGADGVDMADVDGDGKLDLVTGHEQGLRVTLSFNPGSAGNLVESPWPTVTLPTVDMCSVEDAILCDVDADGALDIVSACETGALRVEILFGPTPPNSRNELLNVLSWTRVTLTNSANHRSMRAQCIDVAGDSAVELVIGEKDAGVASSFGYYSSATPRTGGSWTFTQIVPAGWIMQMYAFDPRDTTPPLTPLDINGDTFAPDFCLSDKEGINAPAPDNTHRGLKCLLNDGADPPAFTETWVSAVEGQWKWFDLVDWDADGDLDVVACRSEPPSINEQALYTNAGGGVWTKSAIPLPANVGMCQHTTAVDVDNNGKLDVATAYAQAQALSSLTWQPGPALSARGEISGILDADSDVKMDNLLWRDVDGDGDLDAVSTEQHMSAGTGPGIGPFYAENPLRAFIASALPPAVACTALTSGVAGGGVTGTTASISPTANRPIIVALVTALPAGPAAPTSVIGNGITYTQVATLPYHTSNARRITLLRGLSATPSAGTIVFNFGAVSQTSYNWAVLECSGADTSGTNGSGAIVQNATATATAATSVTATLGALAAATSVNVACSGISINGAQGPDFDFAELTDTATGTGTNGLECEWAVNQQPATPTFASANAGIIAVEVKIAP